MKRHMRRGRTSLSDEVSLLGFGIDYSICKKFWSEAFNGALNIHPLAVVKAHRPKQVSIYLSTWPSAVLTSPTLLSSIACASADGPQVFFLPLVSNLVHLSIIVTYGVMWFTLELSFAIAQASATHQVTVFCPTLPLFANAVVISTVVTPFGRVTSEMSTSQSKTSTPEFKACIRHALPFRSDIVVSGRESVITRVLAGRSISWNCISSSDDFL